MADNTIVLGGVAPIGPGLTTAEGRTVPTMLGHTLLLSIVAHVSREATGGNGSEGRFNEALQKDAAGLRIALEGPNPTPLERLLVERVVVCHMALLAVEHLAAGNPLSVTGKAHNHVDRLQRRYLEAVKALAQVRKLKLPTVPVFFGGQHVHVEGSALVPEGGE